MSAMPTIATTTEDNPSDYLRNADLAELAAVLKDHRTRSIDIVAPVETVSMRDGALVVNGVEPVLNDDGVFEVNGLYKPTRVGDEGLARTFDMSLRDTRRMREVNVPLLTDSINSWMQHDLYAGKSHLYRLLVNPAGEPNPDGYDGVVRAVLSDRYKTIDNFDVLMAVLSGMRNGGVQDPIVSADLTERRMVVRVTVPGIAVHAPELLAGYRSPWGGAPALPGWTPEAVARAAGIEGMGYAPGTEPVVFAGFEFSNSETGGGAFRITPVLEVRVCRNGLKLVAKATKEIHLGAQLDAGVIEWSDATRAANIQLVMAQTTDVIGKFLTREFVAAEVAEIEVKAGIEIKPSKAPEVIATVAKSLRWTQKEQGDILDFFMNGGQMSAGGVLQAVTAYAQTLPGDDSYELSGQAMEALKLAAAAGGRR
jgi:hypothetical protein